LSSLGAAVEFSRANNLLGLFIDADLLIPVPSLIHGIRDAGLLVGVCGPSDKSTTIASPITDRDPVDAVLRDNVVAYIEHSTREVI